MLKFPSIYLAGALILSVASGPSWAQSPARASSSISAIPAAGPLGVRREAGTWLFGNSIFVPPGENRSSRGASPFISHLRRDKKNKLPLFVPVATGAPLNFATLPLPDLRRMSAPNFDFNALQVQLGAQVSAARAAGNLYVGWSLPSSNFGAPITDVLRPAALAPVMKRLRAVLNAVAPESALILQVEASLNPSLAAADIDAAASACDALLLELDPRVAGSLWPLKMARRVAEEQRDFDLPIFVSVTGAAATQVDKVAFDARLMEFWMGGATGFVLPEAQTPVWATAVANNPGLFAGAVTLEDAAVLPSPNPRTLELIQELRAAGRVPLVGRLPTEEGESNQRGETLLAILDEQTSLETLNGLDKAARAGNALYIESLPNLQNKALLNKISEMTGTTLEVLPATKNEVLTLTDPWLFGDARGREIAVSQRIKWTIKTSLAAQARKKKGEDLLQPFSGARLTSDENGLLSAPLGKGRILWLAHAPLANRSDEKARQRYYSAVAGSLQGALVRLAVAPAEESAQNVTTPHMTLRASKNGTQIISIFNNGNRDSNVVLQARTNAPIAFDLNTNKEIAASVSGYSSSVQVSVPARSFAWLTFGATRAALDKERLAPRPKARILK